MKNFFIAVALGFGLSSAPVALPGILGGNFSNSARAQGYDICQGQKITKDWKFDATDSKGKKTIFGPYKCKNLCTLARNSEAGKLKWVVIRACERW